MSIFDKFKFENKDKVEELKEQFGKNKIDFDDMPKDVLIELLKCAIYKIDKQENYGDYFYERDWKDCLCDKEFIVDELFDDLIDKIKLDIYE